VTNKELFTYWIEERWNIFCEKATGAPKPWSEDPIFQNTYFTNVRREDDKVTKYIRDEWVGYKKIKEKAAADNLVPALVLARMFNRPETLSAMGYPYDWDVPGMRAVVEQLRQHNEQVFSGAYLITTCGVKMDKLDYVFRVANDVWKQGWAKVDVEEIGIPTTCGAWHARLMKTDGLGSFLAAQVIADLKNTIGHPLAGAADWHKFVASGPGSKKGMNYWFGQPPERAISERDFAYNIDYIRNEIFHRGGALQHVPLICNQDLQNCLCEFSKYMRIKEGTGRSKRIYRGK
jgi:hypothetical protein